VKRCRVEPEAKCYILLHEARGRTDPVFLAAQYLCACYLRSNPIKTIIHNLQEIVTSFFHSMAAGIGAYTHFSFLSRFSTHIKKRSL